MRNISPMHMGIAVCLALGVGTIAGAYVTRSSPTLATPSEDCGAKYPLTSASLDCTDYDISSSKMDALDAKLTQAISIDKKEGKISRASIWVRNLETKQYAAVNEFDTYEPASLLKLPLAIAYLKFSEIQPAVMDAQFKYSTPEELDERYNYFTASTSLSVGMTYSTTDLLQRILSASDNGAYFTLLHSVQSDFYDRVMLDLGIRIPTDKNIIDFVTVKTYANIFRALYNASYLNRTNSQNLLEMLSKSDFMGLASGVPNSLKVSHKFGERSFVSPDGKSAGRELHDCGIVYKNPDPYTICIMTAGSDYDTLQSVIKDLSKITYDNI